MSESALEKSDAPSLFSSPDAAKLFSELMLILARFRRCSAVMEQDCCKFCFTAGHMASGGWRGLQGEEGGVDGSDKIMGQMTVLDGTGTVSDLIP